MPTVAIIDLHGQPHAHTQALLGLVQGAGASAEIHDALRGRLPARADGMIITGGPGTPEDRAPWRKRLQAAAQGWASKVPVVAIGLGFEVLAQSQGWAVRKLETHRTGWHPLTPTAVGAQDPLLARLPRGTHVFEDRSWAVLPPPAATTSRNVVLAFTSAGDVAAARFGERTVGMIFHPEAQDGPVSAMHSQHLVDFIQHCMRSGR